MNAPLREKLLTIENMAGEYSVNVLCEALNVPKGTYYNYLNRGKHGNTIFTQRKTEAAICQTTNDRFLIQLLYGCDSPPVPAIWA